MPIPVRPAPGPAEVLPFPRVTRPAARAKAQAKGRGTGLAVVAGIHVLFGWALASGLAGGLMTFCEASSWKAKSVMIQRSSKLS